jgi:hypothetical protein
MVESKLGGEGTLGRLDLSLSRKEGAEVWSTLCARLSAADMLEQGELRLGGNDGKRNTPREVHMRSSEPRCSVFHIRSRPL